MGDFNTNRFDNVLEAFWNDMERSGWDVLADVEAEYPPTRLSGVPLRLNRSRIDYIIVTKGNRGLADEEVTAAQASVHEDLIDGDAEGFRRRASDHLPVTVKVKVMADTDDASIRQASSSANRLTCLGAVIASRRATISAGSHLWAMAHRSGRQDISSNRESPGEDAATPQGKICPTAGTSTSACQPPLGAAILGP